VALSNLNQRRNTPAALLAGRSLGAAGREGTAWLGVRRIRHLAWYDLEPPGAVVAPELWACRQKGLGVRVDSA